MKTLTAVLFLSLSLSAPAQSAPSSPALPSPAPDISLASGLDALRAGQPRQALDDFRSALAADPANAVAALYASTAAMELYNGPLAVQYAEQARRLDPQSWKIHTTLVAAYASSGMKQQRDDERALLEKLHRTGAEDARGASGFLLEMFEIPGAAGAPIRVEAIQYFEPVGPFHTAYRFLVHRPAHPTEEIEVQSNDFDERSWAAAHPTQAAAGQRQFQITGKGESGQTDYRMFSGTPDYDRIRAMIVEILRPGAQTAGSAR